MKLLCTFLSKRGYQRGKDSSFLQAPQTANSASFQQHPMHKGDDIWQNTCPHVQRGTHERFSPDSSRISLSGTIIDFTQIIQSFNNLCQTATTSADSLPQKNPSGVLMCPEKRTSLALTLHQLLPPVLSSQHTGKQAGIQLPITSPAASPGSCTQHPAQPWDLDITIPGLTQANTSPSLI